MTNSRRGGGGRRPSRKKRATRTGSRARRESSAGGVVFRIADGRPLVLLIRDSYGNWGFPKGHLEIDERADSAATREVMEETGIGVVSVIASIDTIEWFFRLRGALIHKKCQYFLMETSAHDTRPQRSEGITACQWVTIDEAERLIPYENARAVLRRGGDMLSGRSESRHISPPARTGS